MNTQTDNNIQIPVRVSALCNPTVDSHVIVFYDGISTHTIPIRFAYGKDSLVSVDVLTKIK